MSAPSRQTSVVAVLVVGLAGLAGYAAGTPSSLDRGFEHSAVRHPDPDAGGPEDAEFDRRRRVLLNRAIARDLAVRELLARRVTLGQAAARLRDVEKAWPKTWGPLGTAGPPGDGEWLCRRLIAAATCWVVQHLPEAAAQVTARLGAELEQLRGPDGAVRLPD